jgi:hypothetical protein
MSRVKYKEKDTADLEFSFPAELEWEQLDKQGVQLPKNMNFVDLVIQQDSHTYLVEIKDFSNNNVPTSRREAVRESDFKKLRTKEFIYDELVPKVRGAFTFLHLMERDSKPFKYIILLGLDQFEGRYNLMQLQTFKDRLKARISKETDQNWKRQYVDDCMVFNIDKWNAQFPDWPVTRLSSQTPSS